jgi:hypothetical protein
MNARVTLIVLCVVLAIGAITQILAHRHAADHARGHATVQTKLELDSISSAITSMASFSASLNARFRTTNLDARSLYQILSGTNSGVRFLDSRRNWDSAGELLDVWGRPLRVTVTFTDKDTSRLGSSGAARFKIWSMGPNGKNENGGGDDICVSFDLVPVGDANSMGVRNAVTN